MGSDFLPLKRIDHIELYVGNAKQAAHYYRTVFGFAPVAYSGLETGCRDRASYVLEQGQIRFVLSTALTPDHPIARHCHLHGDGVKAISFEVDDVDDAIEQTRRRGATIASAPQTVQDEYGSVRLATIATYGDTVHRFVDRRAYGGPFLPGYRPLAGYDVRPVGLAAVDHVVGNVELGAMDRWARFYADALGFSQLVHFDDQDISTEYSALMSKVMQNGTGRIKFPLNEPAEGRKKSQIQEFLDYYYGPGVQHIAMSTDNILETVRHLHDNGVQFLRIPEAYYDDLPDRVGSLDESFDELRELGILADRDEEGYLLQIFTGPVEDRPTLFFEIIERHGSRGFGKGNFKALFVSLEKEQAIRGNL